MASSWTVALTYQVLKKFAALITEIDATYSQHSNFSRRNKERFSKIYVGG